MSTASTLLYTTSVFIRDMKIQENFNMQQTIIVLIYKNNPIKDIDSIFYYMRNSSKLILYENLSFDTSCLNDINKNEVTRSSKLFVIEKHLND